MSDLKPGNFVKHLDKGSGGRMQVLRLPGGLAPQCARSSGPIRGITHSHVPSPHGRNPACCWVRDTTRGAGMSNITIDFGQYDDGSVWAECDDCHGGRRFDNPTGAMLWNHECYPSGRDSRESGRDWAGA